MRIEILKPNANAPENLLAEAEIHFEHDPALEDFKLVGFAIWRPRNGGGEYVSFPARAWHQREGKEARSFFDLLRSSSASAERVKALKAAILTAYRESDLCTSAESRAKAKSKAKGPK